MATLEVAEKLKPCIQYLEGFLSSTESRNDLANPLHKSVEILRALRSVSSALPSLNIANNVLHQKVNLIFENGIWVIDNIVQNQANYVKNSTLEELCSLHRALGNVLPELKTEDFCALKYSFTLDQSSEEHLVRHLHVITNAMGNTLEALLCFEGAFLLCKKASACVQEFSIVWPQLKDIITQIESKTTKILGQTRGSHFFNTLDKLFKISMDALWLLFTFPEIENIEFHVILTLCQSVACIFVHATDISNYLSQFFFKDCSKLESLLQELSQSMQAAHVHCGEMFDLKSDTSTIFENVCDKKCSSVGVLKNSTVKGADTSLKTERAVPNSMENMDSENVALNACDVKCKSNLCDKKDQNIDEIQSTPVPTHLCQSTSAQSKVISTSIACTQKASKSSSGKNAKSQAKTTTVPKIHPVSNSLKSGLLQNLRDMDFSMLIAKQRNILKEVIRKYKCHIDHFCGVKSAKSEFQVCCKLCDETLPVEDIGKHIDGVLHQLNLSKNFKDGPEACTVISIVLTMSPLSSYSRTLQLDFRDINFDLLTLNQRKIIENLIIKVKNNDYHYSFTIKTTKSKLQIFCSICCKILLTESIEDYDIRCHHDLYKTCQSSVAACTSMPEINSNEWQFLNFPPDRRYKCSLCAVTSSSSTNSFVQHIHSFVHQSKFKESKFQDSVESKFSNLVGFAHFFYDSMKTKFVSLEVSQKQHVVTLGSKLIETVNCFSIKKNRGLVKLSFVCHVCGWAIVWKNAPEHVTSYKNYYYSSIPTVTQEERNNSSNDRVQENYVCEALPTQSNYYYTDSPRQDNYFGEYLPGRDELMETSYFVHWCKNVVQKLYE